MSVTKNHSPAIPIPRPGKVIDPSKQRVLYAILYAAIGTLIVVAAAFTLSSFLGGSIPPADKPPVAIDNPTTSPTGELSESNTPTPPAGGPTGEPTVEPTVKPTTEPTAEPTPPAGGLTAEPTAEPAASLPPIPENFMVEDEYWDSASFVRDPEGNPSNAGIVFSGFPEGMKLYAPMSGYVTLFNGSKSSPHFVVYISESADPVVEWGTFGPKTGRFIIFRAEEIELLEVGVKDGALYVEKGEPFAEVTKKSELFPGEYKEKPELFVLFDKNWADTLVVSVDSPREYMWIAVQEIGELGD